MGIYSILYILLYRGYCMIAKLMMELEDANIQCVTSDGYEAKVYRHLEKLGYTVRWGDHGDYMPDLLVIDKMQRVAFVELKNYRGQKTEKVAIKKMERHESVKDIKQPDRIMMRTKHNWLVCIAYNGKKTIFDTRSIYE